MRRPLSLLFVLIVSICLAIPVCAHSGSTDEEGGHTDAETGEYHYHHGYPAHEHCDMDGDGDVDCPYDFVDLTDRNPGSNLSDYEKGYESGAEDGYADGYADGYTDGKAKGKEIGRAAAAKSYQADLTFLKRSAFFCVTLVVVIAVCFCRRFIIKERQRQRSHIDKIEYEARTNARLLQIQVDSLNRDKKKLVHENELLSQQCNSLSEIRESQSSIIRESEDWKARYKEQKKRADSLHAALVGKPDPLTLPEDVTLQAFYTPIKGKSSLVYPYGDYTVFISPQGKRYHRQADCVSGGKPYHFFDLSSSSIPCTKCVPQSMRRPYVPDWAKDLRAE